MVARSDTPPGQRETGVLAVRVVVDVLVAMGALVLFVASYVMWKVPNRLARALCCAGIYVAFFAGTEWLGWNAGIGK